MPLTKIQSLGITDGTIVNADINASAAIVSTKLSGVNSELKAWVNFNGTGTVAIRASLNVSSITDGGVGIYTVNFTTAISDANYAALGTSTSSGTVTTVRVDAGQTTSACVFLCGSDTATATDASAMHCAIFR